MSSKNQSKYPMLFSYDIPQADNVYRLFKIVELVNEGRWRYVHFKHDLGITHRQGQYYKTATEMLGLTSREKLTDIGKKFVNLSNLEKRAYMRDLIFETKAMKVFIHSQKNDKKESFLKFKDQVAVGELSDATIKRRMQTLDSWLRYCNGLSDTIEVGKPKIITIEKNLEKLEKSTENHEKLVNMMKVHLDKKGLDVFEDNLVDLICINGSTTTFFEMKSINDENKGNQLKKALGQLIFYKNLIDKNAQLVVVLEKHFDDVDYLVDDPIHVIWKKDDTFESDEKTKDKLKLVFN